MKQKYKGFTLVELIVVITILAILSTIGFVSFQGYVESAKLTTNQTNVRLIQKQLQIFFTEHSQYPIPENSINITSSGTTVAQQGVIGNKVLSQLGVGKDTIDLYTESFFDYSISKKTLKYGIISYRKPYTALLAPSVFANDYIPEYHGNGSPLVLNEHKKSITTSLDIKDIPSNHSVFFDSADYGNSSEKLLKYYYHPDAVSIVNFNDSFFNDHLGNKTIIAGVPSIEKGKVGNGMLVNGNGGGLNIKLNKDLKENLTFTAWIKPKNYPINETGTTCWANSIIMRHHGYGAYMVLDKTGNVCSYRYRFDNAGYHNTNYIAPLNQWTHIAQVWNGNDLKVYINGDLQGVPVNTKMKLNEDLNLYGGGLLIGIERYPEEVGHIRQRFFDGVIDEVGVYNTDLSAAEIKEIYEISQ